MIISHKHKYIFIQLDQTASTAIAKELCENYGGQEVLWKHARYCDFLKTAKPFEKQYYSFSGIRNPLDVVVSLYFKHKDRPRFLDLKRPGTTRENFRQAMFIKNNRATFDAYLNKFYSNRLFTEWKARDFNKLNRIYRFESLQEDFASILKDLNISQIRPLPVINKTEGRSEDFLSYYDTERARRLTRIIFKDEMEKWNYDFPAEWRKPDLRDRFKYIELKILHFFRQIAYSLLDNTDFYRKYVLKSDKLMKK